MRRTISPLEQIRRTRTFSQADLAHLCQLTQRQYSRIETGEVTPTPAIRARLSAVLGVPAAELFPVASDVTEKTA